MATVTGFTAARMKAIEDSCIVQGAVILDNLILTKHDGTTVNAGNVRGPKGDQGIPGINGTNGTNGKDAAPGDVNPTANTTPIRTADGRVKTAPATQSDDAVQLARLTDGTKDLTVARIHATAEDDVSPTSTTNAFQAGPTSGTNTVMDGNEIMTRVNGVGAKTFFEYGINTSTASFTPTTAGDLVHKQYVDDLVIGTELGANVDLNSLGPGIYTQSQNAEASTLLNYPVALAGVLEIYKTSSMTWQTYTPYASNSKVFYKRAYYSSSTWSPWYTYTSDENNAPAFSNLSYTAGYTTYDSVAGVSTGYNAPKIRAVNGMAEFIGGWIGRSGASVALAAGTAYGSVFGTLGTTYRPTKVIPITGMIAYSATSLTPVNWRIYPDGTITFVPMASGTLTGGSSATWLNIPSSRWDLP